MSEAFRDGRVLRPVLLVEPLDRVAVGRRLVDRSADLGALEVEPSQVESWAIDGTPPPYPSLCTHTLTPPSPLQRSARASSPASSRRLHRPSTSSVPLRVHSSASSGSFSRSVWSHGRLVWLACVRLSLPHKRGIPRTLSLQRVLPTVSRRLRSSHRQPQLEFSLGPEKMQP